jgi:transcriptional regulator with XRE-family HTH domain
MERNELVMIVARNLEAAMKRKGTNASELARASGVNPTGIYDILSGKSRSPRLDTLHKIAVHGLHIPIASLLIEPSDNELEQDLVDAIGLMSGQDRRKFLAMARAVLGQDLAS